MKKIIALVIAAFLAISVAAPAQASAPAFNSKNDKLFQRVVTKEAPSLKGVPRKTLVKTAKETCKFLRAGFGILDAIDLMEDNGFSEKTAIAFVAGSVVFYCPEQENNY
jgi:hypothetical protein